MHFIRNRLIFSVAIFLLLLSSFSSFFTLPPTHVDADADPGFFNIIDPDKIK